MQNKNNFPENETNTEESKSRDDEYKVLKNKVRLCVCVYVTKPNSAIHFTLQINSKYKIPLSSNERKVSLWHSKNSLPIELKMVILEYISALIKSKKLGKKANFNVNCLF